MRNFDTVNEAKEYLIAEIADEADREGQPLTPVEFEILHCPGPAHPNENLPQDYFDTEQSLDEFEHRVQRLAQKRRANPTTNQATWEHAIALLQTLQDDYLLMLLDFQTSLRSSTRPFSYWLKVLALAAIFGLGFFAMQSAFHSGR